MQSDNNDFPENKIQTTVRLTSKAVNKTRQRVCNSGSILIRKLPWEVLQLAMILYITGISV